ncbi:MAG: hypothetical protein NTY03_14290 [Candidatus Bathyarchaeota archaeon]|nr:hypothetical protein [Candidatus Bathyarchaeota archaeon]
MKKLQADHITLLNQSAEANQLLGEIAEKHRHSKRALLYLLVWLKRNTGISVNWRASVRVYLSAAAAFLSSNLVLTILSLSNWVALLVCSASFFAVYLAALPLSGALDQRDIQQLDEIAGVTGPLASLFRAILSSMSHIIKSE